jgi:hypothetical protein
MKIVEGGMVTDIAIDPDDPTMMWLTASGYNEGQKVFTFKLDKGLGEFSEGLPNVPMNSIVYQKILTTCFLSVLTLEYFSATKE